jgi:RHS repeat-associated protein
MGCLKLSYHEGEGSEEKSPLKIFCGLGEKNDSPIFCVDYSPFGLTFNSYKREDDKKNNYKYNGKEEHEETGWYDFGARMYQADLGRWFNVDPMAEKYYDMTPYKYGLNNPVAYTDPNGMTEVYGVDMDLGATGSVTSVVDATPDVVENGVRYESMDDFIEQATKDYYADLQKKMSSSGNLVQEDGRPDLGEIGNAIRDQVTGDSFNKDLFEQYWLGSGDLSLTDEQFIKITNAGLEHNGGSVASSRAITLSNGEPGVATVIDYYNTPFALGFGRATVYYDNDGWPVGFRDHYDFNSSPLGTRSLKNEAITRAVNVAGRLNGAKPFTISYGIGPK